LVFITGVNTLAFLVDGFLSAALFDLLFGFGFVLLYMLFVVVGCWLLVVGCWLLVVGCWVVVGCCCCWLLLLLVVEYDYLQL